MNIFGSGSQVLDVTTGNYVPLERYVRFSPMVNIDTSFIYNEDGTIHQIIQVGLGQTKTTVFTYATGIVQSIAVVIT